MAVTTPPPTDAEISLTFLSELTGVGRTTLSTRLARLQREGHFPARRDGRCVRVPLERVHELTEAPPRGPRPRA